MPIHGPNNLKQVKDIQKALPKNMSKPSEDEGERTINALPDYEIRTMKDDLGELGLRKLEREAKGIAPEELTVPEEGPPVSKRETAPPEALTAMPKRAPLPGTEELIKGREEIEIPSAPEPVPEKEEAPSLPKLEELKIPEPSYVPARGSKRGLVLRGVIILLVILIAGGGLFYWLGRKTPSLTPTPEEKEIVTPQPSAPIISVNETKIISLVSDKSLFELLKEEAKSEQPIATLKRIAVLKNEKEFLSAREILQNLEVSIPPYALSDFGNNYNLVLYSQSTGKRLGIIIELQNPENLKEQLRNWETSLLDDFKNFYPVQVPGPRASQTFLNDIHQNVAIRYVNLPASTLTLNYTILSNFLVIGTSKELIYTIIDKFLGTQ